MCPSSGKYLYLVQVTIYVSLCVCYQYVFASGQFCFASGLLIFSLGGSAAMCQSWGVREGLEYLDFTLRIE